MQKLNLFILLLAASCTNKPSRERFPGPPGRTTEFQQAQTTKEVLGGFDPTQSSIDDEKAIRGILILQKGLSLPSKKFSVFIAARPLDGGPPLAVKRINPRKFPYRFALTEDNVMIQGTKFEGFVDLSVRVVQEDNDGNINPLSRKEGDLAGSKRVKVGAKNLEILIDQKIQEKD